MLYEARSRTGSRSTQIDADALPEPLATATIAAEDARFRLAPRRRSDRGRPRGVAQLPSRAASVEGGSTITQQVVEAAARPPATARCRGADVDARRSREAVLALRLEHRLTKDEILALYLKLAPYGNQIEGAERAAQAYFGRERRRR